MIERLGSPEDFAGGIHEQLGIDAAAKRRRRDALAGAMLLLLAAAAWLVLWLSQGAAAGGKRDRPGGRHDLHPGKRFVCRAAAAGLGRGGPGCGRGAAVGARPAGQGAGEAAEALRAARNKRGGDPMDRLPSLAASGVGQVDLWVLAGGR